jgi:hypothetical protein
MNSQTIISPTAGSKFDGNTRVSEAFKVSVREGERIGRVSSEWASRPADQRFLSLDALRAATKESFDFSREMRVESNKLRVIADPERSDFLAIEAADRPNEGQFSMTNWTFGQLCGLGNPTSPGYYLRQLPAYIAGLNLQFTLQSRGEQVKLYASRWNGEDKQELRAVTGPDYGRVPDYKVVEAVQRIAGNGTGDTPWKIPGILDWSSMHYNPFVEPTTESTTLYASDRDVFMFLVDDTRPIEIGKLPDGSPDLIFRGFYVWNSEVGAKSLGIATMYLRACCMNRNLWGVEGFQEITLRHTKNAHLHFDREARPALQSYAERSDRVLLNGIKAARDAIVAADDDEARDFLMGKAKMTKSAALRVIETVTAEEGHPPRSVWDLVQGMTAVARRIPQQDVRLDLERQAGRLLDKVAKAA